MKNTTIIGIDGGASKVSAHVIEQNGNSFTLGKTSSTKSYCKYPDYVKDFQPVDLKIQLSQISNNTIQINESEKVHANAYYAAFIDAIQEIGTKSNAENILLGIGMPGIKSADGRGIVAMANGPRMPNFANEIEQRLTNSGITLSKPIFKLGSDADYCGVGEEYAENGAFKKIENAYYLGGGTGAADALKLHGKLISLDDCKAWFAKTWEFQSETGKSIETYCSAKGIQSVYAEYLGVLQSELLKEDIYLEQILNLAIDGEDKAIRTWETIITKISELLFERICTINSGWQNNFKFLNPNRVPLDNNHDYQGVLLNKIVIGQRIGNLFKLDSAQKLILEPLLNNLSQLIFNSKVLSDNAKSHYLTDNQFNKNILSTSNLREAPALGAGIEAWNNYANN